MPPYLRRPPAVVPRVTEIGNGLSTVLPMLAGVLVPTAATEASSNARSPAPSRDPCLSRNALTSEQVAGLTAELLNLHRVRVLTTVEHRCLQLLGS